MKNNALRERGRERENLTQYSISIGCKIYCILLLFSVIQPSCFYKFRPDCNISSVQPIHSHQRGHLAAKTVLDVCRTYCAPAVTFQSEEKANGRVLEGYEAAYGKRMAAVGKLKFPAAEGLQSAVCLLTMLTKKCYCRKHSWEVILKETTHWSNLPVILFERMLPGNQCTESIQHNLPAVGVEWSIPRCFMSLAQIKLMIVVRRIIT